MEDTEESPPRPHHQWSFQDFLPNTRTADTDRQSGPKNQDQSITQKGYSSNNESNRDCENDPPESPWSLKKYLPKKAPEERYSQTGSNSHSGTSRYDTEQRSRFTSRQLGLVDAVPQRTTNQRYIHSLPQQQQQLQTGRIKATHSFTADQRASRNERDWRRRDNDSRQEQSNDKKAVDVTSRHVLPLGKYQHNKSYLVNDNRERPVDLSLLRTWSEMKDSHQLLLLISSHMKQLEVFLDQQKLQEECLVPLIKAVGTALDPRYKHDTVKQLLDSFCKTKLFDHLIMYTKEKQIIDSVWDDAGVFFMSCIKILAEILNKLPKCAKTCITVTSELLDTARCTKSMQGSTYLLAEISSLYEKSKKVFLEEEKLKQKSRGGLWMANNLEEPPDNFLELPIMPMKADLQEDAIPFIRRAKIEGGYEDVHQYLDVQFRLMRQDFIIPLREGIAEFKKNNCKPGFKSSNLRFYFNVRIIGPMAERGIDHVLHVGDSKFQHFQGKNSKRLMFGSLLCLSKDNFESVIFATVAQDISEMHKGFLVVNFKTGLNDVFSSSLNDVYIMAETTAYFESYSHVLEGLQKMVTKLPLQDYIVHCKTELKPPKYLLTSGGVRSVPVYNISCLLDNEQPCRVPVLTTVNWPQADKMCLNESQRAAAQLALTKELAIIQGPPGTGKTYVGLKVMQVLLENKYILTGSDVASSDPILVVCYTNHALDQFLEGVLNFCPDGIVRVGGQSKSDKLNTFNLRSLRRNLGRYQFDSATMKEISGKIDNLNETMQSLQTNIVTERILVRYITAIHLNSLFNERSKSENGGSPINAWLTTSKETTESILSQMIKQHLIMLVLKRREESRKPIPSTNMNIIKRANLYCYYLRQYENECNNEIQELSKQRLTEANKNKMHEIQYWLRTAGTQILPDHQLFMVFPEGLIKTICSCLKLDFNDLRGSDSDNVIENWLLRSERSLHQQLDDVQMLTQISGEQKEDHDSQLPDYTFLKEQNDRMVDVDLLYGDRVRARVKNLVNNLTSALKRAEALGIRDDVLTENDVGNNGWKTVTKGKLNLRALHRKLLFVKPMTEEEEKNVKSVWSLDLDKRFALYNLWVQRYRLDLTEKMEDLIDEYEIEQEKQRCVENRQTLDLLRKAKVIGMTTSGAARHRAVLQEVGCRIIVVEEAAEVLESHIVTSLNKRCKHLILIGDHQQLRPNPTVYQLAKEFGLEISLFERLIKNKVPHVMLKEQHRMRPEISKIMRHIYPDLQDHTSVANFENIRGVSKNIFFIQHEHQETHLDESMSKANTHEAKFLVAFCQFLLNQDYKPSQITILATYSGQVFEIGKAMKQQILNPDILVTAVDNYQGEENDIILLSLVRSNDENQVGFLKVDNRVCVALSRARKGLFAIGNLQLLAAHSKLWRKIVRTATSEDTIDSGLPIHCHNHPEFSEIVTSDKDFLKFPEGGCGRPCLFRLTCGHVCDLLCHGYDINHTEYKCKKPCTRVCEAGHPCKLMCFVKCLCSVLVLKRMLVCNHEDQVQCHVPVEEVICSLSCSSVLDCGHPCTGICGQCRKNKEHVECVVEVDHKWPCGHKENVLCYTTKLYHFCKQVCGVEHSCGHACTGICGQCSRRDHMECRVQVKHQWSCGHEDTVPCYTTKSPYGCKQVCGAERDCGHVCPGVCGQCKKREKHDECHIVVQHQWPCGHDENVPCYTTKSPYGCKQVCGAERDCGHVCPGVCGQCKKREKHDECHIVVQHQWPCGHDENVPCYTTKSPYGCKQVCGAERDCGHVCPGICGQCKKREKHDECHVKVEHQMPCGHKENVPCYTTKPSYQKILFLRSSLISKSSYTCKQVCGAELECGHPCTGICGQCKKTGRHAICQEPVECVRDCGHSEDVPCSQPKPSHACKKVCGSDLPCGHKCCGICGQCQINAEHAKCKVPVQYRRKCGHFDETPCHVMPSELQSCKQVCRAELKCGHICKGTCSECLQGTVHVSCQEKCLLSLPCGHSCGGFCSTPCLPCTQICPNQCNHGACFQQKNPPFCSHTCPPCMAKWNYRCPHLKYTRICSNICDIQPCAKYCRKYMPSCQHLCAGFCGELCVCRQCDSISVIPQSSATQDGSSIARNSRSTKEGNGIDRNSESPKVVHENTNSCGENEIDKQRNDQCGSHNKQNQRLVKLPSCGHIFCIDNLHKYVNRFDHNGSTYIPCPVCQIPIQNCVRFENINIMRSRERAVQKEKLQHDTGISDKQKADLLASQRFLDHSSTKYFLIIDTRKVTNIVTLRAASFQIKCAFILNTVLSVMKDPQESASIKLLKSRQDAVVNIKGRLTNQQREEFTTELLRFFWIYCLSHLNTINVHDDLKEPQDNEIDAELKMIVKDLGEFKVNDNILSRAELLCDKKNKRIQKASKSQEDKAKSLLLEQASSKVLKILASADDDMLYHLKERNFQGDLPRADHSTSPVKTSTPELDGHARQNNNPSPLSREKESQASKAYTKNKSSQLYKEEMQQSSKAYRNNKPKGSREKMPQASRNYTKNEPEQRSTEEMPLVSRNYTKNEPEQRSTEEMPLASRNYTKNKSAQRSREEMPQASRNYTKNKSAQRSREEMPLASRNYTKNKSAQRSREEMPQASRNYTKNKSAQRFREEMPQASRNYTKNKPPQQSSKETPQASKDFTKDKPPQRSREEMPQASKEYTKNKPPNWSREEMPQSSQTPAHNKPLQMSSEGVPQASRTHTYSSKSVKKRNRKKKAWMTSDQATTKDK